uniref:ABC transporter substrate-binding protein n=1 Tax=Frankia sp. Cr1 TaxID=3073931 RepID=UPI002AD43A56
MTWPGTPFTSRPDTRWLRLLARQRARLALLTAALLVVPFTAFTAFTVRPGSPPVVDNVPPDCRAVPGISRTSARLGLIYPESGDTQTTFAPASAGIDARFAVENAHGGVDGRLLSYQWIDDASDNGTNLFAARTLVEEHGVFGILEASDASAGSVEYLHNQGIPVLGIGTDPTWLSYPNMFTPTTWVSSHIPMVWGEFVRDQGGTRAALIAPRFSPDLIRVADVMGRSLQAAGVQIVATIQIGAKGADATAVAMQL